MTPEIVKEWLEAQGWVEIGYMWSHAGHGLEGLTWEQAVALQGNIINLRKRGE